MKRTIIVDERDGIYLGGALGLGFFSLLDHAGQEAACVFTSESDARDHVMEWEPKVDPNRFSYVEIEVADDADVKGASTHELLAAGLKDKIGLMIMEQPTRSIPDGALRWWVAGGIYTDLNWNDLELGTFECHGPYQTEQEADQVWRARISQKIDTCMHKLRVIQR